MAGMEARQDAAAEVAAYIDPRDIANFLPPPPPTTELVAISDSDTKPQFDERWSMDWTVPSDPPRCWLSPPGHTNVQDPDRSALFGT